MMDPLSGSSSDSEAEVDTIAIPTMASTTARASPADMTHRKCRPSPISSSSVPANLNAMAGASPAPHRTTSSRSEGSSQLCRGDRDDDQQSVDSKTHPPGSSSAAKVIKLRGVILEYLKELETRLAQFEAPLRELWEERVGVLRGLEGSSANGQVHEPTSTDQPSVLSRPRSGSFSASAIVDARARIRVGLEMLTRIRADVSSHLPDLPHLPRASSVMEHMHMPTLSSMSSRMQLPDFDLNLDFANFDFERPSLPHAYDMTVESLQAYIPTLQTHLESLQDHLRSVQLPSSLSMHFPTPAPNGKLAELLYKLRDPNLFTDPFKGPLDFLAHKHKGKGKEMEGGSEEEAEEEQTGVPEQVRRALEKSANGERLICFSDLPMRYKNNNFVGTGYRFIPLTRWPRLLLSIFQPHNETANIWTHFLPLLYAFRSLYTTFTAPTITQSPISHDIYITLPSGPDIAVYLFSLFSTICLFSSCIWHVMAGCAHLHATETAARIDYVGIGWLISASIGSVIYYGFSCRPNTAMIYLGVSFILGIAASILPFMQWFNEPRNKNPRILFFISLVMTVLVPCAHLAAVHSLYDMYIFIRAEITSVATYVVGLLFYAFRFPECVIPPKWTWLSDKFGGGSHAIWHICIVIAIGLHKDAMVGFRNGIADETCQFSLNDAWDSPMLTTLLRR